MKVNVICGSHPRNLLLLQGLLNVKNVEVIGQVIFEREDLMPEPDESISSHHKELWKIHFEKRRDAEEHFFTIDETILNNASTHIVYSSSELNSQSTINFLDDHHADACFITGIPILIDPLFSKLPKYTVNLHLGLIPHYKGSITMFWPFYMLEPTMAGCSYHVIGRKVDTGKILHQVTPELALGDGMHDVAAKASVASVEEISKVVNHVRQRINKENNPEHDLTLENSGKIFKKSDFSASKLSVIYDLYNDSIVDAYLKGEIDSPIPKLVKA